MPSSVLSLVSVAAVSFATGVVVCRQLSTLHNYDHKIKGRKEIEDEYEDSDEDDEEDDVEIDSRDLNSVGGEVRMTLVVRQDLKMGKGKAAAQCSHATLALYKKITSSTSASYNPQMVQRWERNGQAKITLQVPDQETMDMLFAQAMSIGVNAAIIHDAGRTQIAAGSATVLGLGPAPKAVLDQITGDLKLY
ncbi:hypothetical protein PGUG_01675 [Meyerozyma guilliermondii ATCC 6260]|uniref:peptidyl-tRNA hydrolase n=1 Tax=Meyerozyma guilliermondii (strain ATCC 6260 / CBS 566 / DSM 6381 / JCM 1539 / NBRC 10279 / NRRL Y-324) TaxID=294746 RepID=A5DEH4_PICGU|nr:uncharacterized protein PGUG_01675 [Meyerozyma guilliermondii ATCC 6260]EDK37577.2 hypothetical protein PGUG_01675 [Meyerozyma guilliermondii ATCC 6260]